MEPGFSVPIKSLLLKLLTKNPKQRLGAQGAWEVKHHCFFDEIDWNTALNKGLVPPDGSLTEKYTPVIYKAKKIVYLK